MRGKYSWALQQLKDNKQAKYIISKKRREPDPVAAIIHKGIRYSAPLDGVNYGYAQCGGFVTARDESTNKLLWSQSVYSPKVTPNIEDDKLDVFITSMILVNKGMPLPFETNMGGYMYYVWILEKLDKLTINSRKILRGMNFMLATTRVYYDFLLITDI